VNFIIVISAVSWNSYYYAVWNTVGNLFTSILAPPYPLP